MVPKECIVWVNLGYCFAKTKRLNPRQCSFPLGNDRNLYYGQQGFNVIWPYKFLFISYSCWSVRALAYAVAWLTAPDWSPRIKEMYRLLLPQRSRPSLADRAWSMRELITCTFSLARIRQASYSFAETTTVNSLTRKRYSLLCSGLNGSPELGFLINTVPSSGPFMSWQVRNSTDMGQNIIDPAIQRKKRNLGQYVLVPYTVDSSG